ncbi:pimeloyl-ACP methyl ester carboxylesterase [Mycobacterium sp. OAS707]|uniref:alpha/beta fold hydrolase n=1 Tax=Mycobacterium sp. OAS707 TaxID=2663822 RepID=UPI00178B8DFD|nr:alpha/beta hydrolase [Mycobacterium sp. OAS707]MBE1547335.1 pimeloyl-ACP methyl ester carboxylesterase [Mycobacterium sp. OAS707]
MRRTLGVWLAAALLVTVVSACSNSGSAANRPPTEQRPVAYKTADVDGLSIFYREAGPTDGPVVLLLHGFPSSSRMFDPLFARLSDRFHLIAPDLPGFGHSDWPDPAKFAYTFDHLATVVDHFTEKLGLSQYNLSFQDYGADVGMRMVVAHPERLQSLIIQNAALHADALGPLWDARRAFWADRVAHEAQFRRNFLSLEATRQRHVGTDPNIERYDPDLWTDEYRFLTDPAQGNIQVDLFYDYRTNVSSYDAWDAWLREHKPRTMVLWGKYDPSFLIAETAADQRDIPGAELHIVDGGHFALDTAASEMADYIRNFLSANQH